MMNEWINEVMNACIDEGMDGLRGRDSVDEGVNEGMSECMSV
jgi:hypothetical protein